MNDPSPRGSRGPTRPTLVVGLASLGAVIGFIVGFVVGLEALGIELPDGGQRLPTVAGAGAGIGWIVGAVVGRAASSGARPVGPGFASALRAGALLVGIVGIGLALEPLPVETYGVRAWELSPLRMVTLADAGLAAVTLAVVSVPDRHDPARHASRAVGVVAIAGVALLGLLSGMLVHQFFATIGGHDRARAWRAVHDTASALVGVAEHHLRVTGAYPANTTELLSTGVSVRPGAQIDFAEAFGRGFCVVVGKDVGEDQADEPFSTAFTWPAARGSGPVVRKGTSCLIAAERARERSR